jgi:hypothetical protein
MDAIPQRTVLRLAELIRQQLLAMQQARQRTIIGKMGSLIEAAERLRDNRGLLSRCVDRNWQAAARNILERSASCLRDLPYHMGELEQAIQRSKVTVPPLREIVAELQQLQEEFEQVRYQEKDKLLVVATDPLELEEVYLGPFEIRLEVQELAEVRAYDSPYRVVALDPHPAGSNENVTHPHVSEEHLCEGDAAAAIRAAMESGRICDLFLLIRSVLTNYNPGSPYVALSEWDGRSCHDCGCTMDNDESRYCESCDNTFCDGCASCCTRCDETTCLGCLDRCPVCDDRFCSDCLTRCPECNRVICKTCLEEKSCPCVEESQQQENEDEPEPLAAPAGAAVPVAGQA